MVAPAGAGPWPQITSTRPLRVSWTMTGTSPPGPLRWGSTTCKVKAVATAASNALPPFSSVAIPTAVAIQWVEVTTPKVPSISGRVVNGSGLILLMGIHQILVRWTHSIAARKPLLTSVPDRGESSVSATFPRFYGLTRSPSGGCGGQGDGMAGDPINQRRSLLPAEIKGEGASRVERAAGRRVDRVGDLALDRNPLSAGHRQIRHRAQQHLGVGHPRVLEHLAALGDLDNAAEIH